MTLPFGQRLKDKRKLLRFVLFIELKNLFDKNNRAQQFLFCPDFIFCRAIR